MADKIGSLSAVTSLASGDVFPVNAGSVTKKITKANLIATLGVLEKEVFVAREEQSSGTQGGAATSGSWLTRTLNTLEQKTSGYVSLTSNELTIPAGKWLLFLAAPAYEVVLHRARIILDEAGTPAYVEGGSSAMGGGGRVTTHSFGFGVVDYASSFTAKVQHQVSSNRANVGLGYKTDFGPEVYTQVMGIRIGE